MRLYSETDDATASPRLCRWLFGFNLPLYALGLPIAPDAVATDGLLDVCTFERGAVWSVARYLWHVMRKIHHTLPDAGLSRTGRFRLEPTTSASVAYQIDGDYGGTLPVDVEVLARPAAAAGLPRDRPPPRIYRPSNSTSFIREPRNPSTKQITVPNNPAEIGPYRCGSGQKLLVIAGPCVIENETLTLTIAERLADIARELPIQLVFKASFDKANRTSLSAYRGSGMEAGLKVLAKVGEVTGLPVTTDIHESQQAAAVGEVCTLLQVPAFLVAANRFAGGSRANRPSRAREEGPVHVSRRHEIRRR